MSVSIMATFGPLHNNPLPNMQNIRANILSAGAHCQLQFCVTMKRRTRVGSRRVVTLCGEQDCTISSGRLGKLMLIIT